MTQKPYAQHKAHAHPHVLRVNICVTIRLSLALAHFVADAEVFSSRSCSLQLDSQMWRCVCSLVMSLQLVICTTGCTVQCTGMHMPWHLY